MVMREVPRRKNLELKSMQENISKSVTRLTKNDVVAAVDGKKAVQQGTKGYFDLVVTSKTYH